MSSPGELEAIRIARGAATEALINSDAEKRLVVAGPGTGKTYAFRLALDSVGNGGLAITFINALVNDLECELGESNTVNTFHGFCKHLLHRFSVEGISDRFHYYPPLLEILAQDLQLLGHSKI